MIGIPTFDKSCLDYWLGFGCIILSKSGKKTPSISHTIVLPPILLLLLIIILISTTTMSPSPSLSTLHPFLDTLYLTFFTTHIPIALIFDLTQLYPPNLTPPFLVYLREWYLGRFADRFFVDPPAWFKIYLMMEGGWHLPVCAWGIWELGGWGRRGGGEWIFLWICFSFYEKKRGGGEKCVGGVV